jgi:hypothetical protein
MSAERRDLGGILLLRAGIGGEIGLTVELLGVDEDCNNHPVGLFEGCAHQAQMALVQGTHRRHDGDPQSLLAPCCHPIRSPSWRHVATASRNCATALTIGMLMRLLLH